MRMTSTDAWKNVLLLLVFVSRNIDARGIAPQNSAGVFILSERRCFLISSLESLPRPGHRSAVLGLADLVDLTESGELASASDLPDELRAVCHGLPVSTLLYSSKQRRSYNSLRRRQKRRAMTRKHCLMYFAAEICFNSGF
ncbi:hypothetical protein CAPTEDRAFT_203178 [Capitella teleta]|uniref:Secreted protein n=1 Tax=Capitella teleta TaxID=283909 RepID=R7UDD4_CAPTE|nr:hypothetical protein CAPTEDRAFT_203178 [Capitella teleta]|eukprot:ELU01808.1 hypothetical protein CAPTEDRAFT_203178 [Capitella teleta]